MVIVPALVTGLVARLFLKMNFYKLCGLLSGATTNSAVLSFTKQANGYEGVAESHARVYPFALFMQVLVAQLLIPMSFVI